VGTNEYTESLHDENALHQEGHAAKPTATSPLRQNALLRLDHATGMVVGALHITFERAKAFEEGEALTVRPHRTCCTAMLRLGGRPDIQEIPCQILVILFSSEAWTTGPDSPPDAADHTGLAESAREFALQVTDLLKVGEALTADLILAKGAAPITCGRELRCKEATSHVSVERLLLEVGALRLRLRLRLPGC